jgi:hypothetical protein
MVVYEYGYCVSGHYPLPWFFLNTVFRKLDSVSMFRWNLLSFAHSIELVLMFRNNNFTIILSQWPPNPSSGCQLYSKGSLGKMYQLRSSLGKIGQKEVRFISLVHSCVSLFRMYNNEFYV